MSKREQVLLKKCKQILTELDQLLFEAEENFDEDDPNDWWSPLYLIVDRIDNLQRGENLPKEIWMDTELPSEEDELNFDFNWFKIDVQYVERAMQKIMDWIENYFDKEKERKEKKEQEEMKKKQQNIKKPEELKKVQKKSKLKEVELSVGPFTFPITKEQAKYIGFGFFLGFITAILTVVLPLVVS
ncbi:MAG: hypothetical protein ACTSP3_07660 [Candidatus Heimdallarchaeaceae archaeon]